MAAAAGSSRRGAEDREAAKVRRQKIFVGIGGGILLVVVAVELLPALFGSSSSGSGSPAPTVAPVTQAVASGESGSSTPRIARSVARLATRDVFKPQLSASVGGGTGVAGTALTVKGPSVRLKKFVAKDVFIPQIKAAAATPASTSVSQATESQGSSASQSPGASGAGFIIVVASVPGIGPASERAAARALVAARNAGLKEVTANDAVPGASGSAPHFTIYTGPYQFESTAQAELKRALRNGYPHARAQQLPSTSGKGF
jgi:hypothetical protein